MGFRYDNSSDISEACMIRTNTRIITNLYEGIPETLLLNVIGWVILVLLFSVLRQQAWDYGRLALVSTSGDNKRWTQLFYAPTSKLPAMPSAAYEQFNNILFVLYFNVDSR